MDYLNQIINDIASEGIFSLYVTAAYNESIGINSDLITISGIQSIASFILLSPIYQLVLSVLNELESSFEINFVKFIEIIIPNAFLLLENGSSMVKSHRIYIISPFRNAVKYIDDYINSIVKQNFTNFHIFLIDDCSTDASLDKIENFPFVSKIVNKERKFALQNIIHVLTNNNFEDEPFEGMTVRLFNPATRLCSIYWSD